MGKPRFDTTKWYVNKKGQRVGKGVWYDENGKVIMPGKGFFDRKNRTVTQYNTDGTKTTYSWEQWHNKETRDHEVKVLQNDRKYAIPYIPSKKMKITLDNKTPTKNNLGATFSENLLDSIAVNAKRAGLPFSTALGIAAQESTLGANPKRTVGKSMLPWLYVLNNSQGKDKNFATGVSYENVQSPSLLISNWKRIAENPFAAYHYDSKGNLGKESRDVDYYDKDFYSSLRKGNRYNVQDVSPLYHGFKSYKEHPKDYNPRDPNYPLKVERQKIELVNHSPEIKAYMKKHNLKADGGSLNSSWGSLSYRDKAEMMKVAIANGITSLPEIKNAYNEYAKGGKLNNWTMDDEAKYRYWRSKLPKNLRDTNDNDYDMRAAFKAGMQPTWNSSDKSYHLGSRDPNSGRILKSPHHPTYIEALATDASLGYYPAMDRNGNTYTETWQGNHIYKDGGYIPSANIKKRITNWEGSSMKTNRSFEAEARDFNNVIPADVRSRLSPSQLDALYSYGYNVGMGKLKERVLPTLTAYTQGKATKEDVQRSMWATKDSQLRGLTNRRNAEREMFGGNYRTTYDRKNIGVHIDPSSFQLPQTFFDTLNINIPQVQAPSVSIDPSTIYKAPTIDETLFSHPKPTVDVPIYNPQKDRLEGIQRLNTIMGMMGQSSPFSALGNGDQGILSYVNAIYGS